MISKCRDHTTYGQQNQRVVDDAILLCNSRNYRPVKLWPQFNIVINNLLSIIYIFAIDSKHQQRL